MRLWITDEGVAVLGLAPATDTAIREQLGLRPEPDGGRWVYVAPPEARSVVLRVLVELIEDEGYPVKVGEPVSSEPKHALRPPTPEPTFEEMYEDAVAERIATGRP